MKRIAVITASRADWGIYMPVITAIHQDSRLSLDIVALGSKDYIEEGTETLASLALDYDAIVVLGDTMPMLKAAIYAAEHHMLLCHIHGGDATGSIDNKIRYAISAFADWHFPSLPSHAYQLVSMGYLKHRIKVVGPLGIYAMKERDYVPESDVRRYLGLDSEKPIIIVIQHPVSDEVEEAGEQMRQTMEAIVVFSDCEPVIIHPNSELGCEAMIKVLEEYPFKHFENLPYITFVSFLQYASVIVGNSSCGLVEASLFGTPCVNIGSRQGRRARSKETETVPYEAAKIAKQIKYELNTGRITRKVANPWDIRVDGTKIITETLVEI